jgi:hypothetical protein
MKAKLIHRGNGDYKLYVNGATYAQSAPNPHRKLSKQNCDEIFGVVDVQDLATKGWEFQANSYAHINQGVNPYAYILGYKDGFNKSMELNKDKLFTEEQMFRMFLFGHSLSEAIKRGVIEDKPMGEIFNDRIQFLQQPTEIEVTFDPEEKDSEGCLILKKI